MCAEVYTYTMKYVSGNINEVICRFNNQFNFHLYLISLFLLAEELFRGHLYFQTNFNFET